MQYIRAVYEDGHLRLLDPVELQNGEQVYLNIQTEDAMLRAALGDLVRWPDPTYNEHEELEAQAEELRQAFSVGKPLSEMILEDRGEI